MTKKELVVIKESLVGIQNLRTERERYINNYTNSPNGYSDTVLNALMVDMYELDRLIESLKLIVKKYEK